MRAWLYDRLVTDPDLQLLWGMTQVELADRVAPRESGEQVRTEFPYLIYGLGTNTNEALADDDDHEAHRQFFQVWIHDSGGSFGLIDDTVPIVKRRLVNASDPASRVTTVRWLETSGEFSNNTYGSLFRYLRFQAIISRGSDIT